MLISITLSSSSSANPQLPSGLVKISHDEVVLVELQGSLEVDANHPRERNGKFVGKFKIDETTVSIRLCSTRKQAKLNGLFIPQNPRVPKLPALYHAFSFLFPLLCSTSPYCAIHTRLSPIISKTPQNKPTLLIGNHLLEGKIQALPKPLAVLLRSGPTANLGGSDPGANTNASAAGTKPSTRKSNEDDHDDNNEAMDIDSESSLEPNHMSRTSDPREGPDVDGARAGVGEDDNIDGTNTSAFEVGKEPSAGWTITAIVKKKIIFSKRPMPVMNKK